MVERTRRSDRGPSRARDHRAARAGASHAGGGRARARGAAADRRRHRPCGVDLLVGADAAAARCWSSATAAAPPKRNILRPSSRGASRASDEALPAVALTTDTSALTAIGNDYGFQRVFGRQIEALGRPGDVAVGISTSGTLARTSWTGCAWHGRSGLATIALTGPVGRRARGRRPTCCIAVTGAVDRARAGRAAHRPAHHLRPGRA